MNFKSIFKFKTAFFIAGVLLSNLYLIGCGGGGGGSAVQDDNQSIAGDNGMTIYVAGYHPQQPEFGGLLPLTV